MANFRCERVFVMLDDSLPDLNHLRAVDPEGFAGLFTEMLNNQVVDAGLTPLDSFLSAPFERPQWQPASEGLKTVRGLIDLYRGWQASGHNPLGYADESAEELLTRDVAVLVQVETVLDAADTYDRRFYFAAKDLG